MYVCTYVIYIISLSLYIYLHVYIYIYTHVCMYVCISSTSLSLSISLSLYIYIYISLSLYIYIYMHIYMSLYTTYTHLYKVGPSRLDTHFGFGSHLRRSHGSKATLSFDVNSLFHATVKEHTTRCARLH